MFKAIKNILGSYRRRRTVDLHNIPDVDDATVEAYFASTHEGSRRLPLLVAQWEFSKLEQKLTRPGAIDQRELFEIRGGMKALRAFATDLYYGIEEWKKQPERRHDSR